MNEPLMVNTHPLLLGFSWSNTRQGQRAPAHLPTPGARPQSDDAPGADLPGRGYRENEAFWTTNDLQRGNQHRT